MTTWLVVTFSVLAAYGIPILINRVSRGQVRPFAYPAAIAAVVAVLWWALPADASITPYLGWIAVGRRQKLFVVISSTVVVVWGVVLLLVATSGMSRVGGIALTLGGLFGFLGLLIDAQQRRRRSVPRAGSSDAR